MASYDNILNKQMYPNMNNQMYPNSTPEEEKRKSFWYWLIVVIIILALLYLIWSYMKPSTTLEPGIYTLQQGGMVNYADAVLRK